MSDPSADALAAAAPPTPPAPLVIGPRESAAGVVGMTFGLLLVAALVVSVWRQPIASLDGRALLADGFELGELPFELEVASASRLAGGERVVELAPPAAWEAARVEPEPSAAPAAGADEETSEDPAPAADAADPASAGGAHAPDMHYDWTTLELGPAGTPPIEVFVVWYPNAVARAVLDRHFGEIPAMDLRDFGIDGGRLPLEKGTLDWSSYEAGFVIERELERGGTFRDWMRVNLTFGNEARVLFARWARGMPASKERAEELLAALAPREADEATPGETAEDR